MVVGTMRTDVIKLNAADPDLSKIREAAEVVDAGGLVAFPTETVYGIAARVRSDTLAMLDSLKGRNRSKPYTLHIGQKDEVGRYVPSIGLRAERLVENAWPGPLTVVFELDANDIDRQKTTLAREVFEGLYRDNSIGIRCPDSGIAAALLRHTSNPVVAPSANMAGQPPGVNADAVLSAFSGRVDLVIDGGECKYGMSSTVAKIGKDGLEILRAGVYTDAEVETMSEVTFLIVCTGNTCRSPMAEGIFRKYLAEKLGCEVDHLGRKGYKVSSAGVLDMADHSASSEAVAACAAKGVDIRAHRSQTLTPRLVEESSRVFAMERMHQAKVAALSPGAAARCVLLAGDSEIADPIGQRQAVYNACADLIEESVRKRISELVI
jgi:protein-tyrosine phosphatase